jgi:hypothetical protein
MINRSIIIVSLITTAILFSFSLFLGHSSPIKPVAAATGINDPTLKSIQFMPMDPSIQQKAELLRQNFALFEQKLAMSNPQQQQLMLSNMQQGLFQNLAQAPPQDRMQFIQMLQQLMSPFLQQQVLQPVLSQLNGEFSGSSPPFFDPSRANPPQQGSPSGTFNSPFSDVPKTNDKFGLSGSNQRSSQLFDKRAEIEKDIKEWNQKKDKDFADSFNTFNSYP